MGKRLVAVLAVVAMLAIFMLPSPQLVYADSTTIYAEKDTFIDYSVPNSNYCLWESLGACGEWNPGTGVIEKKSILEFDIDWGTDIPTGVTITSCLLKLYYYSMSLSPAGENLYAHRMLRDDWWQCSTTWNDYQYGVNWNTAGCEGDGTDYTSVGGAVAAIPSSYGWVEWDITTQVEWAQDNNEDVFVVISSPDTWTGDVQFRSRDYSGTTYDPKLVITYDLPIVSPTVSTMAATDITETTATIEGYLDDDGNEPCSVRFQFGYTSSYGSSTSWKSGYETGTSFLAYLGLEPGAIYHFRAQAANSAGTDSGDDNSFATLPYKPSYFTATAGDTEVDLTWTKGDGASKTMIRRSESGYPTSPTSGTQVYFNTGTSTTDSGLSNGTTYYYSTWSWANDVYSSGKGTDSGTPSSPSAPECTTNAATNVGDTSARLNGYLDDLNGAASANVSFQYYKDGDAEWGHNTTPTTYTSTGLHYADLAGLDAASLYYFRMRAVSDYGTGYGDAESFTTGGSAAPTMTTQAATGVMMASATLNGEVTDDGGDDVTAWFQWGLTSTNLNEETESLSGLITSDTFYYGLAGLDSNTQYFYRAVGENSEGIAYGTTLNFTTSLASAPTVRTDGVDAGANQAVLHGTVLSDGGKSCQVRFQWGETDSYGTNTSWMSGYTGGLGFEQLIIGLTYNTTYHYRAQAQNEGGIGSGSDKTFTPEFGAPQDFTAKAISHTTIRLSWVRGGDMTLIRLSTDSYPVNIEDGSYAYYGTGELTSVSGLEAGTTYYFRAWSWREGNVWSDGYGEDLATTMSTEPEDEAPDVIDTPSTPSRWFTMPTGTALNNTPFYDFSLDIADGMSIPHGTWWFGIGVLAMVGIGGLTWRLTRRVVIAIAVASVVVIVCTFLTLLPLWFLLVYAALAGGIAFISQRL